MPVHRTLLHFGLNGVGPTGLEPSVGQIWNPQSCDLAKMRTAGPTDGVDGPNGISVPQYGS
jgi:hypothetical protein